MLKSTVRLYTPENSAIQKLSIIIIQGSHCLLEICIKQHETLPILSQWYEKCMHDRESAHKERKKWWSNFSSQSKKWADENSKMKGYLCTHTQKVETLCKFAVYIDRNIVGGIIFQKIIVQQTFSSTVGFHNKMMVKLRLLQFSLIRIWCQCAFCFQFRSLVPMGKLC